MIERDSEDPVSHALEELGTVDPPAGLVENVMMRLSSSAANRFAGRVVPFDRGGIVMIKKAMWGLAAAAAVLLAVFSVIGFPSANRGTEATIGAAQKYQAPQLAAGDVKVGDASVQEFLQSEAFDRLLKDPQARSILSDGRIHAQLINRDFVNSLEDAQTRQQLSNDILVPVLRRQRRRRRPEPVSHERPGRRRSPGAARRRCRAGGEHARGADPDPCGRRSYQAAQRRRRADGVQQRPLPAIHAGRGGDGGPDEQRLRQCGGGLRDSRTPSRVARSPRPSPR